MTKVDYIVVGCGLASVSFCEILKANNKSFVVFDDESQQSSKVAAGLYNPVVLKRFTAVWKAEEQLKIAIPSYAKLEKEFNIKIDHPHSIFRRFSSVEEQNMWFTAADKPILESFLSTDIKQNTNKHIDANFGLGEVLNAGRVDTKHIISEYKTNLKFKQQLNEERFNYSDLKISELKLQYQNIEANNILFAEGFGVKQNPFFNHIAVEGTKGEVLTIKAPDLKLDSAIKSSVFVISIGNDLYRVGATYEWTDKTNNPTNKAREELIKKLKSFIKCDFEVVDHHAGIRPTVKDRRPLVGQHHKYKNLYVLNGLGSRGVMVGPYVAKKLFDLIENNIPLDKEIDVNRFSSI